MPVQLIDCIADLLRYEPKARLTTKQCLEHAYFREVAYRFTPRVPHPPPQQLPTPAPSHTSHSSSYSSTHPGSSLSLNSAALSSSSLPTSAAASLVSPRNVPPSHSHSPAVPSFPNGQGLPSPDHFSPSYHADSQQRHLSICSSLSGTSGLSGYQIQVRQVAASPNSSLPRDVDQRSVLSLPSPVATSGWQNGAALGAPSTTASSALHPSAATSMGRRGSLAPSVAPSVAPSTYYDGSVYEGFAPSRASSVMSFPTGGDDGPGGRPSSLYPALSPQQSRASHAPRPSSPTSSVYSQQAPSIASSAPPAATSTSTRGRWGLFAGSAADKGGAPAQFASSSINPLKRSPSNASMTSGVSGGAQSVASNEAPLDPKKARKEAEKLAKEQEKAARLAKEQQARERARAVMKKKSQLKEAADPLHNFALQGKAASAASSSTGASLSSANLASSAASFLDKGKARALPSDRLVQQRMPQIIEDTSRLRVSGGPSSTDLYGAGPSGLAVRYKARRRDDDDDVHSVSSDGTGQSAQHWMFPIQPGRGRPVSISSKATSASDPERRHQQLLDMDPLARVSSLSSLPLPNVRSPGSAVPPTALSSGSMHRYPSYGHYTAPSTGHSSLDANFISNMQGLATSSTSDLPWQQQQPGSGRPSAGAAAEYRSDSRSRLASPHAHERYSPYMVPPHGHGHHVPPRSPGPTLPPIQSFDNTPPQTQHPLVRSGTAATFGSVASFRSTPASMPSYFAQQQQGGGPSGGNGSSSRAGGGDEGELRDGAPQISSTTYHLPYLPAMDADSPTPGRSPVSSTFPYPSPSLSGTGPPDRHVPHQYTPG